VKVLFSGEVYVDLGQFFVESEEKVNDGRYDLFQAFIGQEGVGLCGCATDGMLMLLTGLMYGDVGLTVEVHDSRPAPDETWEDIVEVPFRPASEHTMLEQWNGKDSWELALERRDYRVRYSGTGMDAAHSQNNRDEGQPQADRYLLQFWPAPPEPARVLKQTSCQAENWLTYACRRPKRSGRPRSGAT
jgi:hypothetical protein